LLPAASGTLLQPVRTLLHSTLYSSDMHLCIVIHFMAANRDPDTACCAALYHAEVASRLESTAWACCRWSHVSYCCPPACNFHAFNRMHAVMEAQLAVLDSIT
jgi:hypothetical protein